MEGQEYKDDLIRAKNQENFFDQNLMLNFNINVIRWLDGALEGYTGNRFIH